MKELKCQLCNKSLKDEKICPYCKTSIEEELLDISPSSFKKLSNSIKSIFGKGLSKEDKLRFENFLEDNSSLNAFIEKYSKTPDELIKDKPSSIKEKYQDQFETSTEILEYYENEEFYLNLDNKKLIYRFRRTFEELDDIIFNLNTECSSNIFNGNKDSIKEFYKNFEDEIPKSLFENNDIKDIKLKNQDTYSSFKEINSLNDSYNEKNLLNDNDLQSLNEFIDDYENIDSKIEDLNCNFKINEKINEIKRDNDFITKEIDTNQNMISIKSSLNSIQKEKEDYKSIFNAANNILENYASKLEDDSKGEIESFISNYNQLDSFIDDLNSVIENDKWLKENSSKIDDLNKLKTKELSKYIEDEELSNLKEENKMILDRIEKIEELSPILTDNNEIKEFKSNFNNLDSIAKKLNDNFWIKENKNKLNEFISIKDNGPEFSISEMELISLKSKNSYNYQKARELKSIYDNDSSYMKKSDMNLVDSFIDDYDNIDSIACDLNEKFKINSIINQIHNVDMDSALSLDELKIQFSDFKELYSASQSLLEEDSRFLDLSKKETIKTFIAYYEKLDFLIVQNEINLFGDNYLDKIEDFNNFKNKDIRSEITNPEKESIFNEYEDIYNQTLKIMDESKRFNQIEFNFKDSCELFIKNFDDFDFIIDYVNAKVWINENINGLIDFNKIKDTDEFIDDEKYEELKSENKSVYERLLDIERVYEKDNDLLDVNQLSILDEFLNTYENLRLIVDDLNCKYKIRKHLEKIESIDISSVANRYVNLKANDFIVASDKSASSFDSLLDALNDNEYDDFSTIHLKHDALIDLNDFINDQNDSYSKSIDIDDNYSNKMDSNQKIELSSFIDTFEELRMKFLNLKMAIWAMKNMEKIKFINSLDCIEIDEVISEEVQDRIKLNSKALFDSTNDILSISVLFGDNQLEKNDLNKFAEIYPNLDSIFKRLNYRLWIRENRDIISEFIKIRTENPNHQIKNDSKDIINDEKSEIYEELMDIMDLNKKFTVFDNSDYINALNFITVFENIDYYIERWNINFNINNIRDHVFKFANVGVIPLDYYLSYNTKPNVLNFYSSFKPKLKGIIKESEKAEKKYKIAKIGDLDKVICDEDNELFNQFFNKFDAFEEDSVAANELYIENEMKINEDFFDDINGKSLDYQQRKAVVLDEDSVEIVAGAGTGKTLTLEAKVKYLIEKKNISPSEILAISFSAASVKDLKRRIEEPIDISTFHALGLRILKDNKEPANTDEYLLNRIVEKYLTKEVIHDKEKTKELIEYFSYYIYVPITDDDVNSKGELYDQEEGRDFESLKSKYEGITNKRTYKGEHVNSLEELYIANFLFLHGINYTYEKPYLIKNDNFESEIKFLKEFLFNDGVLDFNPDLDSDLVDSNDETISADLDSGLVDSNDETINSFKFEDIPDKFKDKLLRKIAKFCDIQEVIDLYYKPDFYFDDYDIYLEHFGVNRNCEALWTDSERYKEGIIWKRETHKKYGTKLIETYSYYQKENRLLERLEEKLLDAGVEFNEVKYQEIYLKLIEYGKLNEFADFIKLIITFINHFKGNAYDYSKFNDIREMINQDENKFKKERNNVLLNIIENIYLRYENYLSETRQIDFNDMIVKASETISRNGLDASYRYILVDEYQDVSYVRYDFLKTIQDELKAKVIVVGDDWQSIYRFTGCDVGLFTNFDNYFDKTEVTSIEKTYRNSQELINISGRFIMKNDEQTKKNLVSDKEIDHPIKISYFLDDYDELAKFELILQDIINDPDYDGSEILVLGRNKKDIIRSLALFDSQKKEYRFSNLYKIPKINLGNLDASLSREFKDKKYVNVVYNKRPDIDIKFMTMHGSKGLEAKNVIIINLTNFKNGIPNKMQDDPILQYVTLGEEDYEHAEERRLFYVALTRAKDNVYLLAPKTNQSVFVKELVKESELKVLDEKDIYDDPSVDLIKDSEEYLEDLRQKNKYRHILTDLNCPECKTGFVKLIWYNEENRGFFGCSHRRCDWKGGNYYGNLEDLDEIELCPKCNGVLSVIRYGDSSFLGCSNPECDFTRANENDPANEFLKTKLKCPKCGEGDVNLVVDTVKDIKRFECSNHDCSWQGGNFFGKVEELDLIDYCNECDGIYYKKYYGGTEYFGCSHRNCSGNKETMLDLACPKCGMPIKHIVKRETGYGYITCPHCDWYGGSCKEEHIKYLIKCTECGGIMKWINGSYGPFLGCSEHFRNGCTHTINL